MLDQFSLTAMAVNYTRAQTQHSPLASQRFVMNKIIKTSGSARETHTILVLSLLGGGQSDSQSGLHKVQSITKTIPCNH